MKKIFLFSLILIFISSCNEVKKPEVIDTTESNSYMTWQDLPPGLKTEFNYESSQWKNVMTLLEELSSQEPERFRKPGFSFRSMVYFSEKGELEKIVLIESISKKVDSAVIDFIKETFKSIPPKIDGKPVKSHTEFTFNYDPGGISFFPRIDNFLLPPPPPLDSNTYFVTVDEIPKPIGGIKDISNRIVYPEKAKKEGIEGKVIVKLFIDEQGNPENSEILKGVYPLLDSEARNVLMNTKFTPGRKNGKAVKVQVIIPIIFKLN